MKTILAERVQGTGEGGISLSNDQEQSMSKLAGDIVIILMLARSVSREATQQLLRSELWQRIPAIRKGPWSLSIG